MAPRAHEYESVPTVSLLVPLYNSVPYLEGLAADIHGQSHPFDEVLMYDDCSSDDSAVMAQALGFNVVQGEHSKRQSGARNCLLKLATGDFVHFHDHDDPIHPQFVERMLPLAASRSIVISGFDQTRSNMPTQHHVFERYLQETPYDLVFARYVHLNAMLVCRKLALDSGGFDEALTLCEEKDFLYKMLVAGGRVSIQSENLAEWRIQQTSVMVQQGWLAAAAMLRKFIDNCVRNLQPSATEKMLEYCLRSAWNYYYAEPGTISELRLMFGELKRRGYNPRAGLGRKMELLCMLLGPGEALRIRRLLATM
jgi:glycosyltransferase involved in cell wall biosynthesis